MTQGIHQLAANMVNQLNRVDVISNNIANTNTVGFKEDSLVEGSFNRYLEEAHEKNKETTKLSEIMNTIPKIDGNFMNQDMGSINKTGNKLDFALNQENLFFQVENKNGKVELTRDGSFKILNNNLVTQNGYKVLDSNGKAIVVGVDDTFTSRIAVVKAKYNDLNKIGNNNYKIDNIDNVEQIQNNGAVLLQGALEQSNVNSIKSMVTLIEAQRKFEQAQKAVTSINDIDKKVIDSVGNNR